MDAAARLNDTMEYHSIIEMMLGQVHKVIYRFPCILWIEFQHNQAAIGIDTNTVEFVDIDGHGWRARVGMLRVFESRGAGSCRCIGQLFDHS